MFLWQRHVAFNCAALLFASLASSVYAQAQIPLRTVTKPNDIFENNPQRVVVGDRIVLKARSRPAVAQLLRSGLQARIFTLRDDQSKPSPITTIDDCDVFLAVVLSLQRSSDTEAFIPALDAKWLNITPSLQTIQPGRYYVVFEQLGPQLPQFRLKHGDYRTYFDSGFLLQVDANRDATLERVKDAYLERRNLLNSLRLEIDDRQNRQPCYTYRQLSAEVESGTEVALRELDSCENIQAQM